MTCHCTVVTHPAGEVWVTHSRCWSQVLSVGPVESFDQPVSLEGCDCWGDLARVVYEGDDVLLVRTDSLDYGEGEGDDL